MAEVLLAGGTPIMGVERLETEMGRAGPNLGELELDDDDRLPTDPTVAGVAEGEPPPLLLLGLFALRPSLNLLGTAGECGFPSR